MRLSIIIPAYNEEKRIGLPLERYGKFFADKAREILDYEIIVVINNTHDRTEDVVKKYQKSNKNIICLNFKQGGKGFAIKEGFKEALRGKADLIGFIDADMATSPEAFYDLVKNIRGYDGIIASRYVKGAVIKPRFSFRRVIVSRIFNFLVHSLFFLNYKDTQCGAKLFKRKALEKILPRLSMSQWAFDVDLLYNAKKLSLRIKEQPTFWIDKEGSKINLKKSSIQMLLAVMQLRILSSKFKKIWWIFKPLAGLLWKITK